MVEEEAVGGGEQEETRSPPKKRARFEGDGEDENPSEMISVVISDGMRASRGQRAGVDCPYMDTVNRSMLDFDFEKVCSVSLENLNVYACLVCGKYLQGRGRNSHVYFHSLDQSHHVFINLDTEKVYCVPDGYEIVDSTLDDIKHAINPQLSPDQVASLNDNPTRFRVLNGTMHYQGLVGMNNLHATDYANAVLQSLFVITPFRNFCLLYTRGPQAKSALMKRLGELVRKVYNSRAFRSHVSPHEFMQEVVNRSNKQFKILEQGDPVEFIAFVLNTLHGDLGEKGDSEISRIFRGMIQMITEKDQVEKGSGDQGARKSIKRKRKLVPYFFLSLDLPSRPLFKDSMDRKLIPQVPLHTLLSKFDGVQEHHMVKTGERRVYRIEKLPQYLILHIKRFTRNNFFEEKNPTIVQFPATNLELKDFVPHSVASQQITKYDLVAAVTHEGEPKAGSYQVNIKHPPTGKWFQIQVSTRRSKRQPPNARDDLMLNKVTPFLRAIQDLNVKETLPQLVTLTEAHILFYEAQQPEN
ncbi:hypothetical protein NDN08_006387 [Rhodosorus marinus]|uniref:Ubiquitinyl hydrolase 1 n=1 Tax=Rhodosorus marinus TaxID=101924 RepID=A0AAV8UPF2_9RHOD|nr:hypothetical protein NDN08_006387 [Rhodosorus marinus]